MIILGLIATSTIVIAAAVIAAASAAAGTYSTVRQGQFQEKAAKYNAKVAENNAKLAQFQAQSDADRLRDRNRRLAAKQRAAFAKSGVSIVEGSAYDVQYDSAIQGELDALMVLYRGRTEGSGYRSAAAYNRAVGRNAGAMTPVNAAATGLGGLANAGALYVGGQSAAKNEIVI